MHEFERTAIDFTKKLIKERAEDLKLLNLRIKEEWLEHVRNSLKEEYYFLLSKESSDVKKILDSESLIPILILENNWNNLKWLKECRLKRQWLAWLVDIISKENPIAQMMLSKIRNATI